MAKKEKEKKPSEPIVSAKIALLIGLAIIGVLVFAGIKNGSIYFSNEYQRSEHAPADPGDFVIDNDYMYLRIPEIPFSK